MVSLESLCNSLLDAVKTYTHSKNRHKVLFVVTFVVHIFSLCHRNTLSNVNFPNPASPHNTLSNVNILNSASPHNTVSNVNVPHTPHNTVININLFNPASPHNTVNNVNFPNPAPHTTQ